MDGDILMRYVQLLSVGSNIMLIISMMPEYQMGYHLCELSDQDKACVCG